MQYLFKTRYNDDIKFLAKTGEKIRVAIVVICLLAAPLLLQDYYLAELGLMLVYAIAGIGLMICKMGDALPIGLWRILIRKPGPSCRTTL